MHYVRGVYLHLILGAEKMKRRIISMFLALSLLAGTTMRPQRANAVAVTATVVAASAAAILTACGVSYWAATQTDAVDYISGKLEDYLSSIEVEETPAEWLEVSASSQPFTVIAGGALRFSSAVANKLLGFVRWFQQEEGLESGGEAVSNAVSVPITSYLGRGSGEGSSITATALSESIVSVEYTLWRANYGSSCSGYFYIPVDTTITSFTVTCKKTASGGFGVSMYANATEQNFATNKVLSDGASITVNNSGKGYLFVCVDATPSPGLSNAITDNTLFEISNTDDLLTPATAIVTPSAMVNIPADIEEGATFDLTTSADIASADDVDSAAEAIIDGVTSEDGLTSTVNESSGTSWGWLYTLLVNIGEAITDGVNDIKQAVLGLADSIYNKFTMVLQEIKSGLSTLRQDVVTALGEVKQAVIGIPSKIDDTKQAILGLPSRIAEAVRGLFVPSADWADTYVSTLYNAFADRVGLLTYPLAVAESFLMRFLTVDVSDPVVSWSAVREPFSEQVLIQAGSYNFNTLLENEQIARVHEILLVVVKAGMAFTLFELCRKKYNTIIHGGA